MDLSDFAEAVGVDDPVTIAGLGTRGGGVSGVRVVNAPSGIDWIQADEMTACCGAGTPVDELDAALREMGQCVAAPATGTIGGVLAVGLSGVRRLGHGPVRDALLQARYVSSRGEIVKAGGPTVKNVSGFDLCRLLVGSRGTLGFIGEVIVRTRPLPRHTQWFSAAATDPGAVMASLYRPVSVLWDGSTVWALLEGHVDDVGEQAGGAGLTAVAGPPELPSGGRTTIEPSAVPHLAGEFVAEVGVGVVHWVTVPAPAGVVHESSVTKLARRLKAEFDPTGRLNPGVVVGS